MFMFVLLQRVCTHARLGILETSFCVYIFVFVQVIYTCNTVHVGRSCDRFFRYMFSNFWSYYIYLYIYLSISLSLYISLSIYLFFYLSISLYLYLFLSIAFYLTIALSLHPFIPVYLNIYISLFISIYISHVLLDSQATSFCVYVCDVVEGIYTCKNGYFGNKTFCLCLFCCIQYLHI